MGCVRKKVYRNGRFVNSVGGIDRSDLNFDNYRIVTVDHYDEYVSCGNAPDGIVILEKIVVEIVQPFMAGVELSVYINGIAGGGLVYPADVCPQLTEFYNVDINRVVTSDMQLIARVAGASVNGTGLAKINFYWR